MRTAYRVMLAAAAMQLCTAASALAQNYSGVYSGTYTASQAPGQHSVTLTFSQTGTTMDGKYATSTGVAGTCSGTLSGNTAYLYCHNTTSSCPGDYQGPYTFSASGVTWTYTGYDCLGYEEGKGVAYKLARRSRVRARH